MTARRVPPPLDAVLGTAASLHASRIEGEGPAGQLPLTPGMLRSEHPGLAPHEHLPADSRLWAALQRASGGTWAGCVYDVDRIVAALDRGTSVPIEIADAGATAEKPR